MKQILSCAIAAFVFMIPAAGQRAADPTRDEIWSTRYLVADGFSTAISSLYAASLNQNDKEKRVAAHEFCAAKIFEYWLATQYDATLLVKDSNTNNAVEKLESSMRNTFRKLQLTDDQKRFPLGHKESISNLDGTRELSESVSELFTPYFPPRGIKTIEAYDGLIARFRKWIDDGTP